MDASLNIRGPVLLHLALHHQDGGVRLELAGELDVATAEQLVDACRALPPQTADVRLDLSELAFLDAAGLRALVRAQQVISGRGGRMSVSGPRPLARRVMAITGQDAVLTIEPITKAVEHAGTSAVPTGPGSRSHRDGPAQADLEVLVALEVLVGLVARGVPGCDGASVSLLRQGEPVTLVATDEKVRVLDRAQYDLQDGPCVTAMLDNQVVTVVDYAAERRWPAAVEDLRAVGVRSSLSMPLSDGGVVLGGLNLYAQAPASFTDASRAAAGAFAQQAVAMLGYLGQLHTERAGRAQERDWSSALQQALLPTLPVLPRITSAARYRVGSPDARVGGDWYDVFALPDGAVGVAIGDVAGHDMTAAAAMGQLRSVLRSYAYEGSSPSVVLDRLDRLVQDFQMAQLATAIYGRLILDDPAHGDSGMLLFSNAGHLPPMLRTPDGSVTVLRRAAAPLIGAVPPGQARRGEAAVVIPGGSTLLLYTDGLVETRTADIDAGIDALRGAWTELDPADAPEQVCDGLLTALAHPGQDDDVALLALRLDRF